MLLNYTSSPPVFLQNNEILLANLFRTCENPPQLQLKTAEAADPPKGGSKVGPALIKTWRLIL